MKVLFLLSNLQMGGAETLSVDLVNGLSKQLGAKYGLRVYCLLHRKTILYEKLSNSICSYSSGVVGFICELTSALLQKEQLIISCTETYPVFLGYILHIINRNSRLVYWLHTDPICYYKNENFFRYYFILGLANKNVVCVVISEYVNKRLKQFVPNAKSKVIYNCIPDEIVNSLKSYVKFNSQPEAIRFGYIGRVSDEKGSADLIKLLNYMETPKYANSRIKVFTDNAGFDYIKKNTKININQIVKIGVSRSEIYNTIDCVIILSYFEGFSLVALESMLAGKYIIYRNCLESIDELVNNVGYPCERYAKFNDFEDLTILIQSLLPKAIDCCEELNNSYDEIMFDKYKFNNFVNSWRTLIG